MIAVFDRYTNGTNELQEMIQRMVPDAKSAIINDEPFAPRGISSLYDYFIYEQKGGFPEERELHYNSLDVPDFWEIRLIGWCSRVYDMSRKKADIYFVPESYNVQRVEWCMEESSWIYKIDYYNKYALKYATEFRDTDGNVESKVYYSSRNQEVIVEQPQNNIVSLLERGQVKAFFTSYAQFIEYYFRESGLEGERVLFVQDQKGLELAAMQLDGKSMWKWVLFPDNELLGRYAAMGGKHGRRYYVIPEEYPANGAKGEALILTASDQLEGIEYLIQSLPEVTFHIAANTQVSDKLRQLEQQQNVNVYPQISSADLNTLWDRCDFYLDINHYREIFNAVDTAQKKNLLILGFDNTAHCRELTNESYIFPHTERERLMYAMKGLVGQPALMRERLAAQQEKKRKAWDQMMGIIGHTQENV